MTRPNDPRIAFGPFVLDGPNAQLLRDGRPVAITPKSFDVLHHLAARPQRLVTKKELLSALWPDVIVSDASVKVCIREVRKVLGDGVKTPKYIETVHRRGYRFVGEVVEADPRLAMDHASGSAQESTRPAPALPASALPTPAAPPPSDAPFVGREAEIAGLCDCFARASIGERRVVLVAGGAGSGKTSLVEGFVRRLASSGRPGGEPPTVLVGHCFEQFGMAEPYLPVWEAVGRLARERPSPLLEGLLARHAAAYEPVTDSSETTDLPAPPGAARATSARMLRDISEAVEALAAEAPVVLVLEDVHWADYSTLDLISALARRRTPARLLVVATYRPAEVVADNHPLADVVHGLVTGGLCTGIRLGFLDEPAVARYLAERFPGGEFPRDLPGRLHQRTEGHPLFLARLVGDLVEQGLFQNDLGTWRVCGGNAEGEPGAWLAVLDTHIPATVRAMIGLQLERLTPEEQRVLEAAAVSGVECSGAAVAAALEEDVVRAEAVCDDLARRELFLASAGASEWPDGTVATHYRFVHELYHNLVYERIPVARRARLHQTLGLRLEAAWGGRAGELAAELAMHFEQGRDWPRAVACLRQAADAATRQYAHREAVTYLRRALAALERLPAARRAEHELAVLRCLGVNLQVTKGFAAPEVEEVHSRAYALCVSAEPAHDISSAFPVLWGIWVFHKVRSDLRRAADMSQRLLALAEEARDSRLLMQAHQAVCVTSLCSREPATCTDHMARAAAIYEPEHHAANTQSYGQDPGVATLAFGSVSLWLQGRGDEAVRAGRRSVELARRLSQPSSLAIALHFSAMLNQLRGDAGATEAVAAEAVALAADEGFSFWLAGGRVLRGWARAARGEPSGAGVREILQGLEAWRDTGSRTYLTYYLGLLADALLRGGRPAEAHQRLAEALAEARELPEGLYEAELHRLRARALLDPAAADACAPAEAFQCLSEALAVARRQGAKWFELQSALDLAALLRRQGRSREADAALQQAGCDAGQVDPTPDAEFAHNLK
jgi:DNA-binding winged helix-turn-helix (wHTH) protein/predicted ATPase